MSNMFSWIIKNSFLLAVAVAFLFCSCSSDEQAEPVAANQSVGRGSITGRILPKDASTEILAVSGTKSYGALLNNTGYFTFTGLPVGTYVVKATPRPGYAVPASISPVSVSNGYSNNVGTIHLHRRAYLSFLANNQTVTAAQPMFGVYIPPVTPAPILYLTSHDVWYSGTKHVVQFYLSEFSGSGTYAVGPQNITYYWRDLSQWQAVSGEITITSFNSETRLVSGTFSFVAAPKNAMAVDNITITEGEFEDFYIQP